MDTLVQDLRQALRSLRGSPGFAFATIATLVLGLGITAVMFTVVYGVLARPLPYENPDELIVVLKGSADDPSYEGPSSYPGYEYWRDNARAFDELAAYDRYMAITLWLGDDPERISAARVSANYFSTLGAAPVLGRDFRPEEDEVGADTVMILSHEVWTTRFAADPDVVGRKVRLSRSEGTIIGVMPADFTDIHDRPRLWLSMTGESRGANNNALYMVGRVHEGVSLVQTNEDLERVRVELTSGETDINYEAIRARSLHEWRVGDLRAFLRIAAGAVALVMLIVVANLSNLALVHTTNRGAELAVRAAIGAGRLQIVRLLLVEALVLGLAGAALALVVASQATAWFLRLSPATIPRHAEITFDAPVFAFVVLGSVLVSMTASLLAIGVGQRRGLVGWLRPGGRHTGSGSSGHRAQGTLAVAQLGLALALLVAVGLLMRSLISLQAVDTGFVAQDALVVELSAPADLEPGDERRGFYEELAQRIQSLPGVDHVGVVSMMPFTGWSTTGIRPEGTPVPEDEDDLPSVEVETASPGFFAAMGTQVLAGRDFRPSDTAESPRVAIVNRAMVERFWPDQDPLGRLIFDQDDEEGEITLTVVGVTENVRARGVDAPVGAKFYTVYAQSGYWWPYGMNLVLRSSTPPQLHSQPIRDILRDMVAQPPLADFTTLEDWLAAEFTDLRFQTSLFGIFAIVATLLAGVGLYGVIASGVARRTHEIGVRMALGADSARMLRQVIGSGARLAVAGTLVGAPLALLMARAMESMLFGISSVDLPTLVGTVVALNAVCIAACWLPARRASRVAPLEAMRH